MGKNDGQFKMTYSVEACFLDYFKNRLYKTELEWESESGQNGETDYKITGSYSDFKFLFYYVFPTGLIPRIKMSEPKVKKFLTQNLVKID